MASSSQSGKIPSPAWVKLCHAAVSPTGTLISGTPGMNCGWLDQPMGVLPTVVFWCFFVDIIRQSSSSVLLKALESSVKSIFLKPHAMLR